VDRRGEELKFTSLKKLEFQKQPLSFSIRALLILFLIFCRCFILPFVCFITLFIVVGERKERNIIKRKERRDLMKGVGIGVERNAISFLVTIR
jgi:hypothetical protein